MDMKALTRSYFSLCLIVFSVTSIQSEKYEVSKNVEVRGFIEDIINSTLTKIIASIPDPIRIPFIGDDFGNSTYANNSLISGKFNVSNLGIYGLSTTEVSAISFNLFTQSLNLTLKFSDISTHFKYWTDLVLLELVPLYGSGTNTITMEELQLFIHAKATLGQNLGLSISNVSVILNLGDLLFDINGLIDDGIFSALVDIVLNDNVQEFVNGHQEFITRVFSPIVQAVLNYLLHPNSLYYQSSLYEYREKIKML
ncbi:unnamed protein product [Phaedon cochleariae]|uniref:Uncharacterized protein n=1 Tax=Phaedon cochleariae TaxID=80249 RepID=A0A9N9X4T7_PHACE|nr:unnamed protein product [Phaedon cochleariae]